MITLNRNLILSLEVKESDLFIKMSNSEGYIFKNNIKISYEDYYENIGEKFDKSDDRVNHKPWELIDYDLYHYILFSKKDFIEFYEG